MQKNNSIAKCVFGVACYLTLLAGCGGGSGAGLSFKQHVVKRNVTLTGDAASPQCKINLTVDFAEGNDDAVDKAVNAIIVGKLFSMEGLTVKAAADSFANKYCRDYQQQMLPLYRDDQNDAAKKPWYEYEYSITTETVRGRGDVTAYIIHLDYFEGGAHGISQQLVLNLDGKTGRQVTLNDVFVPGYEVGLNNILLQALEKKTGTKNIDELRQQDYLFAMDIFAPENFILGKDAITFIYNPYEIAPYSKGFTTLDIPYDDLKELMPKQ